MADFPNSTVLPLFVHTFTRWAAGWELPRMGSVVQASSLTWPVANTAFYVPMWIPFSYPVERVFWVNGTSTTTTNVDFGIYTFDGTKIYSTGSVAQGTASIPQYVTPSPEFVLSPGRYYFGFACSSVTANRGGQGTVAPTVPRLRMVGVLQQATALALPATMTPSAVANACYPFCGVTRTTTGFT